MIEFLLALATLGVSMLVSQTVGYRAFLDWLDHDGSLSKVIVLNLGGVLVVPALAILAVGLC